MLKLKLHTALLLSLLLLFGSCGNDDDGVGQPSTDTHSPTPIQLEYPAYFGNPTLPENNPITLEKVALGRALFYDPILSDDKTVSCASCHKQENGFNDRLDFSRGINNQKTTRSSMSIVNLAWQNRFFWDGSATTLEEQALKPIENPLEMNLSRIEATDRLRENNAYRKAFFLAFGDSLVTPMQLAQALSSFERTLISKDSKYDKYKRGEATFTAQEQLGEQLFFTHPEPSMGIRGGNCGDCHAGALTSSNSFNNNGLDSIFTDFGLGAVTAKAKDNGKFKAVSLRNIAVNAPYMHDGRFTTLEEVLDHYNEHIVESATLDGQITNASNNLSGSGLGLTENEKKAIIAFLKTLTDNEFLTKEEFSDPFK